MGVLGPWLCINCTCQKPFKPLLPVETTEQITLLVPIPRQLVYLQPEDAQVHRGLRDVIDDATMNALFDPYISQKNNYDS